MKDAENEEIFYLNSVWFCIPNIARGMWEISGAGIVIFTIQSCERRSKESKNTFRRFTNNKGNVNPQSLKRLWDLFCYKCCNI